MAAEAVIPAASASSNSATAGQQSSSTSTQQSGSTPKPSEQAQTTEQPSAASGPKKSPTERALEALRASKQPETPPPEAKPAEQPKTEDKPAAPTVEERLAQLDKGFATLNKREAALRAETEKLKAERGELDEYKKLKARAKLDPTAWMKAGGLEFDQVVQAAAAKDGKPPNLEVLELQETVNQLKQQLDDKDKREQAERAENDKKAGQKFIADYRGSLEKAVTGDTDKYDVLSSYGQEGIDWALYLADQYALEHKRVPDINYILDIAERHLYDEEAKRLESSKKLKSKFAAPQGDQPQVTSGKAAPASPKKPPTLNNGLQGNAPARDAVNPRKLTGSERVKWALESTRRS